MKRSRLLSLLMTLALTLSLAHPRRLPPRKSDSANTDLFHALCRHPGNLV